MWGAIERVAEWFGYDLPLWLVPAKYRDDVYIFDGYEVWAIALTFLIARLVGLAVWIAAGAQWGWLIGLALGWVPAFIAHAITLFIFRLVMPVWRVVWLPLLTSPIWLGAILWMIFPPARPM